MTQDARRSSRNRTNDAFTSKEAFIYCIPEGIVNLILKEVRYLAIYRTLLLGLVLLVGASDGQARLISPAFGVCDIRRLLLIDRNLVI